VDAPRQRIGNQPTTLYNQSARTTFQIIIAVLFNNATFTEVIYLGLAANMSD
jgi:hypothetical protein